LDGSDSLNGDTQCWNKFGQARARPSLVT
jgi:hypothetical protein